MDGLRIQTRNQERGNPHRIDSPIFYSFDIEARSLTLSFFVGPFIVTTTKSTLELHEEYERHSQVAQQEGKNILDFESWLNHKFMDDRGIEEV